MARIGRQRGLAGALPWFRDSRDFPVIAAGLRERGFVDDELRRIMGLNWLHQLEQGTAPRP